VPDGLTLNQAYPTVTDSIFKLFSVLLIKSFIPLVRGEWRLLLFGFFLMFFSSPGQTYFIALFGGEIRQDLNLSHGEFGAIYSIATVCSAITLLWSGTLIDRLPLRKITVFIVCMLAVACLVMSFSQNFIMLFIAVYLLRHFGQGLMSMTSTTAMMRYLSSSKGKANSLSNMGYSVAEAMIPTMIISLLLLVEWRTAWQLVSIFILLLVPALLLWLSRQQPERHQQYLAELKANDGGSALKQSVDSPAAGSQRLGSQRQWTRAQVIRDPLFYLFVPALVSQSLLYTGFMFHQVHLVEVKGWSLLVWGSMYFLFSITTILSSLLIGGLVDKVGAVRLVPFIPIPMAIGLLSLSSSNAPFIAGVFMLLMGISTGAQAAISAPFYAERYGNKYFASIKSLASFVMIVTTGTSPIVLGWLIDRGVSMDTLAFSGAVYALIVTIIGYSASRRASSERATESSV
jgi:sugar phosphate permease